MRFLLICLSFSFCSFSQSFFEIQDNALGIGLVAGNKTQGGTGGLMLQYKFKLKADVELGLGGSKYLGLGGFLGSQTYFFNSRLQPMLHASYQVLKGEQINIGNVVNGITSYSTSPSQFIYFGTGVRFVNRVKNPLAKGFFSLSLLLSYRWATQASHYALIQGHALLDVERKIQKDLSNGFGIGIKAIYFLPKIPKKD